MLSADGSPSFLRLQVPARFAFKLAFGDHERQPAAIALLAMRLQDGFDGISL